MGMDQSIFVGPYLVVTNKEVDKIKVKRICVNPKCKKHNKETKDKFCAECGSKIESAEYTEKEKLYVHDILNEDEMYVAINKKNKEIIVSNNDKGRPVKLRIGEYSDSVNSLIDVDKVADINWFITKYAHVITKLETEFGSENISVDWGIIISWS